MFVLDSSALIEVIEQKPNANAVGDLVKDELLITTSVCMQEVLVGVRSPKDRFVFDNIFSSMEILNHDAAAARVGADIERQLSRDGAKVNPLDVLIAAICITNDAELVTLDNDFSRVKGLRAHVIPNKKNYN